MVEDAALTPEWIRDMLVPILLDPDLVAAMSQSAADMGARESDEWLAAEVLHVMREHGHPAPGGHRQPRRPGRAR